MARERDASTPATEENYSDLERLSALETLKALARPEEVKLADLVDYLEQRQLWSQFAKITLGDIQKAFAETRRAAEEDASGISALRKRKRRILADELQGGSKDKEAKESDEESLHADGGIASEAFAGAVLPFIEGNGDVSFDDIVEYTGYDRKVVRHHLGLLVKAEKLERLGTGRSAVYSTTG